MTQSCISQDPQRKGLGYCLFLYSLISAICDLQISKVKLRLSSRAFSHPLKRQWEPLDKPYRSSNPQLSTKIWEGRLRYVVAYSWISFDLGVYIESLQKIKTLYSIVPLAEHVICRCLSNISTLPLNQLSLFRWVRSFPNGSSGVQNKLEAQRG